MIRSEPRLRNVFDLPRTAHSGNDRGSHIISSYRDSMRALFGSVHDFGCPIRQSHAYAEVRGQLANCRQYGNYAMDLHDPPGGSLGYERSPFSVFDSL